MKKFLLSALVLAASTFAAHAIEGELSGKFIINTNGDSVHFSQGILQYHEISSTWSFADYQFKADDGALAYFGWGTSGWNSGANEYQPTSTSADPADYFVGGNENNNLTGDYAYADWGIYNPIENGGNIAGLWRVLTHEEWVYIIESRPNAGKLFGFATIDNQYKGVILLPDEWVLPSGVTFKPGTDCYMEYETGNGWRNLNLDMQTNYNDNKYTLEQWETMEEAGAVFFPAMGYLTGGEIRYPNDYGYYASSSARNGYTEYAMEFDNKSLLASDGAARRGNGVSVRLVTNEGAGQGIDNINHKSETINHKFIKDGQLFIERNGKIINVLGQPVR